MTPYLLSTFLIFVVPVSAQHNSNAEQQANGLTAVAGSIQEADGSSMNTEDRKSLKDIERAFKKTIDEAVKNGTPQEKEKAEKYEKQLIDSVEQNKKLENGINSPFLNEATKGLGLAADIFKAEYGMTNSMTPQEREKLVEKVEGLQKQFDAATTGAKLGDLEPAFENIVKRVDDEAKDIVSRATSGQGKVPNPGGNPNGGGLYGPILGGLMQGDNAAANGRPADALAAYQGVAALDPKNAQAVSGISSALFDLNQYGDANQAAKQALELDPKDQNALTVLHFSAGRIDGVAPSGPSGAAEKGAGAGAASFTGTGSGRGFGGVTRLGAASLGSSSSSGGLSAGGANSRLSGEQARTAAQGALAMNDFAGALAFVNRGLALNPNDPGLLNMRSSIFARQHDYAQAAADAKAGLASAPKNPALLRSLGFAQLRGKDYQGASATANEMLELNPADPYAYAIRGHSYGSMGDRDAMMSDLSRAAELDSSFAPAAAKMASQTQLPSDKDMLFLFPGEEGAAPATAPAGGRARNFGVLVGASALGGLLLALGLLSTVLAPLKEKLTSAFTRMTRSGPAIAAAENDAAEPASVNGFMPGLIRGQYEISRQIGIGGMGMVFAGTDRSLGRPVAIKKMREELRVNPQERARFVIEAKTVAALHHPNIVDIYAIAEDGHDVFLVFEYVDGKTVHEVLRQAGRLQLADAARIVRSAADALGYAHSRGVVHRDMKPSNMMIDASGAVKVMDFGIARMAKDAMTRYSMTNNVVGTPPYMAPEQEQGQVRRESDVYALAVCAYEMMTGKLPFIGIGAGMLMNKINMSYVAPSRAIAGLPEALDEVFVKAFQADPDKRWRTPKEFSDALVSALPSTASSPQFS